MAGYEDTRKKIIETLMGRPNGEEIQPENHQDYALNMLNYIRSLELIANGPLIGIATPTTQPVQPNDARACYLAGVAQDRTVTFQNFRNYLGQPIQITNGQMEACLVILIWDTQYWSAETVPTSIISQADQAYYYYNLTIRKTYPSVAAMNADVNNPIGNDGKYIKVGEIVSVVNSTTPSENGIYSYEGATEGWKYQSSFNFQVEQVRSQDTNTSPSSKLFDDELTELNSDLVQVRSDLSEAITALEQEQIQGGIYDVSSHNDGAVFESLSTLLDSANLSTLIPTSVRRGGMSIRFVQSSDNNYMQFRYMGTSTAAADFTNTANWQGVDTTPTVGSRNLVTSGGVKHALGNEELDWTLYKSIDLSGGVGTTIYEPVGIAGFAYIKHPCSEGSIVFVTGSGGNKGLWGFVDSDNKILAWSGANVNETNLKVVAPENSAFLVLNAYSNSYIYQKPIFSESSSVESKIDKNRVDVSKNEEDLSVTFKEKEITVSFEDGKYITSSGTINSNNSYKYGTFQASRGDIIILNAGAVTGNCVIAKILTFNEYSKIVPVVFSTGTTVSQYKYVCEIDGMYAISGIKTDFIYKVYSSMIYKDIEKSGLDYAIKRIIPNFAYTENKYRTTPGTIANLSGYAYTSPYYLKKGTSIKYTLDTTPKLCSIVSEVDSNGVFIRSLYSGKNVAEVASIVIDKDGYYSFSTLKHSIANFVIVEFVNGELFFNNPLDHLFLNMESNAVPPREILRSPSFVGIVHKWGFIGDSLSSGEQAVYEDGTSTLIRPDKYDYSWGQRMCALNSVEGYNFSAGGQTTKGWCTGTGDRVWESAQLEANWKQAYCIALGVNDRTAPYPKGDVNTDIDLSDYNNNADTFAGWYAGIIQRLRSVNPKCRIFCITIPYNNRQGYLDNNEIIRAIVPKFSKCYLVDLANYHWTPDGLALNDHLSPAGYQWAAWEINTYIDWIIRNNMSDFRDIAFVGTNYSADIQ